MGIASIPGKSQQLPSILSSRHQSGGQSPSHVTARTDEPERPAEALWGSLPSNAQVKPALGPHTYTQG